MQKKDGLAYGTQTGFGGYDDSYAYLFGLTPDHQGEAVVHVSPTLAGEPHEAELLLRWADSAMSARGYECLFSFDGSIQVIRPMKHGVIADYLGPVEDPELLPDLGYRGIDRGAIGCGPRVRAASRQRVAGWADSARLRRLRSLSSRPRAPDSCGRWRSG